MFTVLSFAELGSWDDVKMNGRAALEEYDEFLKELPDSKRVIVICWKLQMTNTDIIVC